MNKLINREKLQYTMRKLWDKAKLTFAKVDGENTFSKVNVFEDAVMLKHVSMYAHSPINNDSYTPTGASKAAGSRAITSHSNGNKGYVKAVRLRVLDKYAIGDVLNHINLWAVEKRETLDADEVVAQVHNNSNGFVVKGDSIFPRYIELPVNQSYDKPTYFIVGHGVSISYVKTLEANSEDVVFTALDSIPAQGSTGITTNTNSKKYLLQYGLVGENMNVAVEIEKLTNIAGGSVASVNSQTPDDSGNVTLEMEHISGLLTKFDEFIPLNRVGNGNNQIPETNADGKLHPSVIPDIAITSVSVVASADAAMQLEVQQGDVVVITGEQGRAYICLNAAEDTFAKKFVSLSAASVSINTINQVAAIAGNLDLGLNSDGTQINLTANNQNIASLPIITEQEVNNIINSLS